VIEISPETIFILVIAAVVLFLLAARTKDDNSKDDSVWLSSQKRKSPQDFEQLVGRCFSSDGWKVQQTPRGKDGGVDLWIERRGTKAVVQCKRYKGSVGVKAVRELYAVIRESRAKQGYLVTTGSFSGDAKRFAANKKSIVFVDGKCLERWHKSSQPLERLL